MKKLMTFCLFLICVALFSSCEHKDLCYDHEPHIPNTHYQLKLSFECEWEYNIEDNVDWEQCWKEEYGISYEDICPKEPEGVRVHIYNDKEHSETVRELDRYNSSIYFHNEGYYNVLFYNNDTEYITFTGMESFSNAYASTRGSQSRGGVMNAPDMLFGAYLDSMYVERSAEKDTMQVILRPLVFTYLLRFEASEGAELIKSAGGTLTGMAAGVSLGNGHTSSQEGALTFQCDMKGDYGTQGLIRSFGIPDYPNPHYASRGENEKERKHELYLQVQLINGNSESFKFDITEQMIKQPRGGVILIEDLKIGRNSNEGAFDVGVEGWGNSIDVPLN